jgi:DNA invertase Pin-like site-specific DNA recombinase
MTTRCAIYARQSLDRSGERAAVDRQVADCRRLAELRGWEVVTVLSDNDMSASTGKPRPAYGRLLNLMVSRQVDAVIVWHIDRLTRRLVDLEEVIRICEATGVRLATVTGDLDLDLSTDTGQLVGRILASVAAAEGKRKGARQRAANQQRAENGHMGWTRRPFAYDRDDGGIVVVDAEADALRAAADMVLGGATLAAAVRMLDAAGLTTTGRRVLRDDDGEPLRDDDGGKRHGPALPWNVTSLRRALLNPRYSGRVVYRGVPIPDTTGQWPVILDADTQDRLAEILRDSCRRQQQGTEVKHLLSGLARCGACGAVMFGSPMVGKGRRWQVYKCTAKTCFLTRRADLVDGVVTDVLMARLARPDAADLLAPETDLDALRAEKVELEQRRDDLADLLADGLLSREKVTDRAGKLTRRIAEVEARIAAALGDSPAAGLIETEDVAAAWEAMDVRARKAAIDSLMTVTVLPAGKGQRFTEEQVRIDWKSQTIFDTREPHSLTSGRVGLSGVSDRRMTSAHQL